MKDIEAGSAKFLPAVMLFRDTKDECMAVSPMVSLLSEVTNVYGQDAIEEMGTVTETESFKRDGEKIIRTDSTVYKPMPVDFVTYLIAQYDKLKSKKSNYIELCDENYNVELYFSTNQRYLVNAKTFECIVIKNQHTKSLLASFASRDVTPRDQLTLAWMLAKTE
jgi:hypothetical protein